MKKPALPTLLLTFLCCHAAAETYLPGSDRDPALRAAKFLAETQRPFAARAEIQYAALLAGKPDIEAHASAALLAGAGPTTADPADETSVFRHYNRGVAQLAAGNTGQGLAILEALASSDYRDETSLALRDKLHLALGDYYLEQHHNSKAREHFRAVRRLSPYANRALVGLGWALLKPDNPALAGVGPSLKPGQQDTGFLWSGSQDDVAWARRRAPFRYAWSVVKGEMKTDLRNAMVPWMELIAGNPQDPAVQEGLLILPYAMTHMGDFQRAERYYNEAQQQLRAVHAMLQTAIAAVANGELAAAVKQSDGHSDNGWDVWLCRAISDPRTAYLSLLIGDADFLDALQDYRELHMLRMTSLANSQGLASTAQSDAAIQALRLRLETLLARIDAELAQQQLQLHAAALGELSRRQQRVEMYIAEAGFALARIHDSPRPITNALLEVSQ